jgi:hypothetical protein
MNPELLPRKQLVALCLNVIGTMDMNLQQKASAGKGLY